MMKERIETEKAPAAIGPYSQAIVAGDLVFVSGQIPLDPATGAIIEGDVEAQTDRVMKSVEEILRAAGSSLDRVVKTTVYLADLGEFERMNRVYASYFADGPAPARATVQVSGLPKGVSIEIDAVAVR